jgi:sec-independent protein translocase protein TatB
MFDIAFSELLLIGLVALIVLGPKRLPEVARTAGRWMARIRRFVTDVKQDFDREMRDAELTELRRLKEELDETRRAFEDGSGKLLADLNATQAAVTADLSATASPTPPAPAAGPATPTIAPPPVPAPAAVAPAPAAPPARPRRAKKRNAAKPPSAAKHGRARPRTVKQR